MTTERPDFHVETANNGKTVMITPIRECAKEWCRANLDEHWTGGKQDRWAPPMHGRSYLFAKNHGGFISRTLAAKYDFSVQAVATPWSVSRKAA